MNSKILVIDDDLMIGGSLKRVLTYDGFEVATANNGPEGLKLFDVFQPDLIVLDVTMPGLSGIDVCRNIKSKCEVPVLFLSARDEVADRVSGLDSGGDDYLVKPFAFEELLARVRALLRRKGKKTITAIQVGDLTLDTATCTAMRNSRPIELSATEYQLLVYLMSNPRQVLTKEMILEAVWGYDFGGESNIVEVYIRYLRTKIEHDNESKLIHTVRGLGYILKES